jgi:hypothetical protein
MEEKMKKILAIFALFCASIFAVSCGGGSSKIFTASIGELGGKCYANNTCDRGLICDVDNNVCVEDPEHPIDDSGNDGKTDTESNPDSDNGNTTHDDGDTAPDNGDTMPDNGDTADDSDDGDTVPDNGDTEPENDYPQTPCDPNPCINDANSTGVCTIKNASYVCTCINGYIFDGTLCIKSLPECTTANVTPCIDSTNGLIWSAKSENKMPWNDAVNYCQNLTEGDFNDWRLPSIAVLKTLVQNCSSAKCADDYSGKYSKFGDTVYLWSSSEGAGSTANSIYFSDASTSSISTDTNVNVRCVRRETESRESNCTGLIENSVWNTATQITQTWDWETAGWTPSPEGSYNTVASSSECRFKCDSSSFREGSKCLNPCKPNPCNSIGETGTCIGKSANEYTCECENNYVWDGSSHCLNPCDPNPCTGIGETGVCLGKNANEYRCECENNYVWDSSSNKCKKNLCQNNPCNIPNSTGTCNQVTETQYTCECEENYYWWGENGGCTMQRPGFGNICTGQTSCYNASSSMTCPTSSSADFFGQDAQYAAQGICTPQSFTVQTISSEKVVLDNNTGLMWQQTIPTLTHTWGEAVSYCNNLTYASYIDWRLPTPKELLTIVNPAIDTSYFPGTPSNYFWSSSTLVGITSGAWIVYFNNGHVISYDKTNYCFVRCVRGAALPTGSFTSTTVQGDVIVTDTETELIWQKTYVSGKTWQEALSYCESLTYAGYSDWRLPNKNELASLVNYGKYKPASDFPDMPSNGFWSSSTYVDGTDGAWVVGFGYGDVGVSYKTSSYPVRCVR